MDEWEGLLQPLRIPSGWHVVLNELVAISPGDFGTSPDTQFWFKEDIFQAINRSSNCVLDVGWYPEFNPKGNYRILVVELKAGIEVADSWADPIEQRKIRTLPELVATIEDLLVEYQHSKSQER